MPLEVALRSKMSIQGDCWVWIGPKDKRGRPRYWLSDDRRYVKAHRYTWESTYRGLREDEDLTKTCSTELCVNPEHHEVTSHAQASSTRSSTARTELSHVAYDFSWHEQAACRNVDPQLFFYGPWDKALSYCEVCPVREQCAEWAESEEFFVGVAGGKKWRTSNTKER